MIFETMVFHILGFGTFLLHKLAEDSIAGFSVQIKGVVIFYLQVVQGDEGVSDRDHCLSIEEQPYYFCLCWLGHYVFIV